MGIKTWKCEVRKRWQIGAEDEVLHKPIWTFLAVLVVAASSMIAAIADVEGLQLHRYRLG